MKRVLACLLALLLLTGCGTAKSAAKPKPVAEPAAEVAAEDVAEVAAEPAAERAEAHQIESKSFPFYLVSVANRIPDDFTLYFVDGAEDLPFVELSDWARLMNFMKPLFGGDAFQVTVEVKEAENKVILSRENARYTMEADFDKGTISFMDYVAFIQSADSAYMNPITFPETDQSGQPNLLKVKESRNLYGDYTVLDLKQYGIPMIAQDGKYLLPLQTLSAFLVTNAVKYGFYFNGEALFLSSVEGMKEPKAQLYTVLVNMGLATPDIVTKVTAAGGTQTERMNRLFEEVSKTSEAGAALISQFFDSLSGNIYSVYSSVPKGVRSQALTDYSYNELCMELDSFYGLKEAHNISSFDTFFRQSDMYMNLTDPDPSKADKAIADLVGYWLDDGHSAFLSSSATTENPPDANYGMETMARSSKKSAVGRIRAQYPEAALPYYEVGDTAYVCFDGFSCSFNSDYYQLEAMPNDTIGILVEAHKQITREGSPIKNVVLDLSNNGGGSLDAALFTLGWFLGDASFSFRNTFTGAQTTSIVRADVNLDHQFDENDTLSGRGLQLYCLTSPLSFSCGNLVPWAFKENGGVTLLGKVTGGGSCMVGFNTTAWGASYQYSSSSRLSFLKNGAYYDVDQGVQPDFVINDYEHFYDRAALTEFIHSLY